MATQDELSSLEPFMRDADPAIRAIYLELKRTRAEMLLGFEKVSKKCTDRLAICAGENKERDNIISALDTENRISKARWAILIGTCSSLSGAGAAWLFSLI